MNKTKVYLQAAAAARMILLTLVVSLVQPTLCQNACDCSADNLSNGVEIDKPGCALRPDSPMEPTCFVQNSTNCKKAVNSAEYPGAALVPCSVEDALFTAAQLDDVDSIVRFRELGASLDIERRVPYPYAEFDYRVSSLIEYAVIWGSFHVIEDMLLNDDFDCDDKITLFNRLCRRTNGGHCSEEDERIAIENLIRLIVTRTCGWNNIRLALENEPGRGTVEREQKLENLDSVIVETRCDNYTHFASLRTSLDDGYRHVCGGVLISERAVLTAAHCVDGTGGRSIRFVVLNARSPDDDGDYCPTNTSEARAVAGIVMHPKWFTDEKAKKLGNGYDLAVIKLNKPSEKTPIRIQGIGHRTLDSLKLVGLGRQSEPSGFASNLHVAKMSLLNQTPCEKAYDTVLQKNILCMDHESKFCDEDGELLIDTTFKRDRLVGIAHLKDPSDVCENSDVPGLYVDVRPSKRWIVETVKKLSKEP